MPPTDDWRTAVASCRDAARQTVRQTVYRQCHGASVSTEDIEDLCSETIQHALEWIERRATEDVDEAHLRNTVRLIAKRRALNWYYRRYRRSVIFDEFRDIIESHLHQRQDDRETLSRLEDIFEFARDVLDADDLTIIRMKYMEEKDHGEIARTLGLTTASSRARLSRALKKLADRLREPMDRTGFLCRLIDIQAVMPERDAGTIDSLARRTPGRTPEVDRQENFEDDSDAARHAARGSSHMRTLNELRQRLASLRDRLSPAEQVPAPDVDIETLGDLFSLYGRLTRERSS